MFLCFQKFRARTVYWFASRVGDSVVREVSNKQEIDECFGIQIAVASPALLANAKAALQQIHNATIAENIAGNLRFILEIDRGFAWKNFCDGIVYLDKRSKLNELEVLRQILKAAVQTHLYHECGHEEVLVNDKAALLKCYGLMHSVLSELGPQYKSLALAYKKHLEDG